MMQKQEEEKTWPQVLAILSGSLAVITSGFLYAWGSPFVTKIAEDATYKITEDEASYITIMNYVTMIMCPFTIPVMDIIGRKNSILFTAIPFILSILIKAFATELWLFYVSRLCFGLGDAVLYCSLPVYIGEVSTPQVRGVWGNAFSIGAILGHFVINVLGTYFSIQTTSFIGLIIPIMFLATFTFMPESPYYFVMRGKYEEAKDSLRRLRYKYNVDKEFDEIKTGLDRQMLEEGTWKDLFSIKSNRKALFAGLFLRFGQSLSGIFVFSTYSQYIFHKAGSDIDSHTSAMIYSGLVLVLYIVSNTFTDKLGRRYAHMISLFIAAIIDFAEGTYFYLDTEYPDLNLESVRWFPLCGLVSFSIVASCGFGIIPSLMTSELFSASIKLKAVSLLVVCYAVGIFIVNNIFYYFNSHFGMHSPFFFFGACNVLSTFVTYSIVPETKGKTLEEIQLMLKK